MDSTTKAYQKADTLGKSPVELVIKVYDGAINAYSAAADHYQSNELQEGYEQLQRARKFITHLYTTLDTDKGGQIAENLGKLYAFMLTQTDVAEATKDVEILNHNIKFLKNLRGGWSGIRDSGDNVATETPTLEATGTLSITG